MKYYKDDRSQAGPTKVKNIQQKQKNTMNLDFHLETKDYFSFFIHPITRSADNNI